MSHQMAKSVEQMGILVVHRSGLAISQSKKQPPVLLMIAGFPDSADTWDSFAKHFESTHHVVQMAYPGMDQGSLPSDRRWGYSNQEVVTALLSLIQDYRQKGCKNIYLMGHDWGGMAVLHYMQEYPETIQRAVLEDVGLLDLKQNKIRDVVVLMSYHFFFTTLFVLTRFVGGTWWYKPLLHMYPWRSFGPLTDVDIMPFEKLDSFPHKLYPYFQAFKLAVLQPSKAIVKFAKVPQMFVFGKQKRCMLHSQLYLDKLDQTPGCVYKAFDDAGHWIHESHAEEMATDVLEFLKQ